MTVIAAAYDSETRQGCMVADSLSTDGLSIQRRTSPKIQTFDAEDGRWLLGLTGQPLLLRGMVPLEPVMLPQDWLWRLIRDLRARAKDDGHHGEPENGITTYEVSLMLLTPAGLWVADAASDVRQVQACGTVAYDAIGAGTQFALGAMFASFGISGDLYARRRDTRGRELKGKTLLAVRAACEFSAFCGGRPQVVCTDPDMEADI